MGIGCIAFAFILLLSLLFTSYGNKPIINRTKLITDCKIHTLQYLSFEQQKNSRLLSSEWNHCFHKVNGKHVDNVRKLINYVLHINGKHFNNRSITDIKKIYSESKFNRLYLSVIPNILQRKNKMNAHNKRILFQVLHIKHKHTLIISDSISILVNISRDPLFIHPDVVWQCFYELVWSYFHNQNGTYLPDLSSIYSSDKLTRQQKTYVEHLIDNGLMIWYIDTPVKLQRTYRNHLQLLVQRFSDLSNMYLRESSYEVLNFFKVKFLLKLLEDKYDDFTEPDSAVLFYHYFDDCVLYLSRHINKFGLLEKLVFAFSKNNGLEPLRNFDVDDNIFAGVLEEFSYLKDKIRFISLMDILIRAVFVDSKYGINGNVSVSLAECLYLFQSTGTSMPLMQQLVNKLESEGNIDSMYIKICTACDVLEPIIPFTFKVDFLVEHEVIRAKICNCN
eukprot:501825_1